MYQAFRHIIIIAVFLLISALVYGQTAYKSERDLIKNAEQFFRQENYVEALPLYSQLLSLYPQNTHYNFKFGVCMLMADKRDIEKPLQHLKMAAECPDIDKTVFYFLGLAYHYNYRFSEAIRAYNRFLQQAPRRERNRFDAARQIEMCYNGMALLDNISDLYVLERHHVTVRNFQRSYNLKDFGGRFLALPEELRTRQDRRRGHHPLVFFRDEQEYIYYSSYGDSRDGVKDIYRVRREADGLWGEPQRLPATINTEYNEDYPFIMPDGYTLFFSSQGHNSMGGYDIFKTTFDTLTGSWTRPENLDFAINTPYDDIFFVTDTLMENAFFASNRVSDVGMINVYKVRIDTRRELDDTFLAGAFNLSQDDPAYQRTLEFLNSRTQLVVNATESMFERPEKEEKPHVADLLHEVAVESYEDMSPSDILHSAEVAAEAIEREIAQLKTAKNTARDVMKARQQKAEEKQREAVEARQKGTATADPIAREEALVEAAIMQAEASRLFEEAAVVESVYNTMAARVAEKEIQKIRAERHVENIQKAVEDNQYDRARAILVDLNENISATTYEDAAYLQVEDLIEKAVNELPEVRNEMQLLREEIATYAADVESLKAEAEGTRNRNRRDALLQEAAFKENEKREMRMELNQMVAAVSEDIAHELTQEPVQEQLAIDRNTIAALQSAVKETFDTIIDNYSNRQQALFATSQSKVKQSQLAFENARRASAAAESKTDFNARQSEKENAKKYLQEAEAYAVEAAAYYEAARQMQLISQEYDQQAYLLNKKVDSLFKLFERNENEKAFAFKTTISEELQAVAHKQKDIEDYKSDVASKLQEAEKASKDYLSEADDLYAQYTENRAKVQQLEQELAISDSRREANRITNRIATLEKESEQLLEEADALFQKGREQQFEAGKLRLIVDVVSRTISEEVEVMPSDVFVEENIEKEITELQSFLNDEQTRLFLADVAVVEVKDDVSDTYAKDISDTKPDDGYEEDEIITDQQPDILIAEQKKRELESEVALLQNAYDNIIDFQEERLNRLSRYAVEKSQSSQRTMAKADSLMALTVNERNEQERQALAKQSDEAYKEALAESQEAMAVISLAQSTEKHIATLIREKNLLEATAASAENLIKQGRLEEADEAIRAMRDDYHAENTEKRFENELASEEEKVKRLQSEATELIEKSQRRYIEADSLMRAADNLRRQAQTVQTSAQREQMINESITLEQKAQDIKETADEDYNKGRQLEIEVGTMRMKVSFSMRVDDLPEATSEDVATYSDAAAEFDILKEKVASHDFIRVQREVVAATEVQPPVAETHRPDVPQPVDDVMTDTDATTDDLRQHHKTASERASEERRLSASAQSEAERMEHLRRAREWERTAENTRMKIFERERADNHAQYLANKEKISQVRSERESDVAVRARLLESESEYFYNRALQRRQEAAETDIESLRRNLFEDAERNERMALERQTQVISLYEEALTTPVAELPEIAEQTPQVREDPRQEEHPVAPETDLPATEPQQQTQRTIIVESDVPVREPERERTPAVAQRTTQDSNLIESIEGVFFTVQIGVFGGARTAGQLFNLTPLYYDRLPNGWYRYFSGVFSTRTAADEARRTIVARGISDAFIVAFFNGRRISIGEAMAMIQQGEQVARAEAVHTEEQRQETPPTAAADVITETALFYSVQVGVYRNQRNSEQLFNLSPLTYEPIANGLHRHLFGVYDNRESADGARNEAVRRGVTDAFVVAYYNGNRISLAEARRLAESGVALAQATVHDTTSPSPATPTVATVRTPVDETAAPTAQQADQPLPPTTAQEPPLYNRENVVLRIQIGAFRQSLAPYMLRRYREITGQNIDEIRTSTGLTVYLVGSYNDLSTATNVRNRIVNAGIEDAFIVAYHNDERIPLNIARDVLR